jgi:hypothetical protein
MTFVHNHAHALLAGDFFVAVTARLQVVYVFMIMIPSAPSECLR